MFICCCLLKTTNEFPRALIHCKPMYAISTEKSTPLWNSNSRRFLKKNFCRLGKQDKQKDKRLELYFTYLDYDYGIRKMIYTTNWIERLNKSFEKTIKVRGSLPSVESALVLLGGVAMSRTCYYHQVTSFSRKPTDSDGSEPTAQVEFPLGFHPSWYLNLDKSNYIIKKINKWKKI